MIYREIAYSACKSCDCAGSQWVSGRPPSCPKPRGLSGHLRWSPNSFIILLTFVLMKSICIISKLYARYISLRLYRLFIDIRIVVNLLQNILNKLSWIILTLHYFHIKHITWKHPKFNMYQTDNFLQSTRRVPVLCTVSISRLAKSNIWIPYFATKKNPYSTKTWPPFGICWSQPKHCEQLGNVIQSMSFNYIRG